MIHLQTLSSVTDDLQTNYNIMCATAADVCNTYSYPYQAHLLEQNKADIYHLHHVYQHLVFSISRRGLSLNLKTLYTVEPNGRNYCGVPHQLCSCLPRPRRWLTKASRIVSSSSLAWRSGKHKDRRCSRQMPSFRNRSQATGSSILVYINTCLIWGTCRWQMIKQWDSPLLMIFLRVIITS